MRLIGRRLCEDDAGLIHCHFSRRDDHLVAFVLDIDAQAPQLADQPLDLLFERVTSHIAQVFVAGSAEDFVNHPCEAIGDSHLGFIG